MRKGFTLIELIVASFLLGMLITVLTMIFNQSSIAWRSGVASCADLDDVRDNIAEVRDEADNAFVWNGKLHRSTSLWDGEGDLRSRACDADSSGEDDCEGVEFLENKGGGSFKDNMRLYDIKLVDVGSGDSGGAIETYTINVKSAGPDREFDTWDDIWSFPDDFD